MSDHHAARDELVEAIQTQEVVTRYGDRRDHGREVAPAVAACAAIGQRMNEVADQAVAALGTAGITATNLSGDRPRQLHTARIAVPRAEDARRAWTLLEEEGWFRDHAWSGGAERSFWANSAELRLRRRAEATLGLTIVFGSTGSDTPLRRLLRPGAADWRAVDLPTSLWWMYRAIRPARLVASRLGLPVAHADAPFLSTPTELIDPLLDVIELDEDDLLIDLGCGDGRIVIRAAERHGCRAIGIERSAQRVDLARRAAARSTASGRIEIRAGEALAADVGEVTAVVMFLPVEAVAGSLDGLLARLPTGARVLAHEQLPLPADTSPPPVRSVPVVGAAALTVAHVWVAG